MDLRTSIESDTYVYATSPINFAGLAKEDLLFWMVPMAVTKQLTEDSVLAFAVGVFCLWLYKKFTAKKPPSHLILASSVKIAEWEKKELVRSIPPLWMLLKKLNLIVSLVWRSVGLMPAPEYCNRYEP